MCKLDKVAAYYSVKRPFFGVAVLSTLPSMGRGEITRFPFRQAMFVFHREIKKVAIEMLSEAFESYFSP